MSYWEHFADLSPQKSYDEKTALSLAIASELAYEDEQKIRATVARWGFELVAVINKQKGTDIDTQCFIMANEQHLVVVFRGSDAAADWFGNFQATQDPGPLQGTWAHEGFQDALYPAVIALTRQLLNPEHANKYLWVTGHSLGGALSSLYAGMLLEHQIPVFGVYTFGSPRPGSPHFERQLNQAITGPHFRVVNDGDVVPHLPPEPFFSHPGKRVILKSHRKERTKASWFRQRVQALEQFIQMTDATFDVVDNHLLAGDGESYIPKLISDLARVRN